MKFEELKINLKKQVDNNYLLVGSDEYLLLSAYNLIVKYSNIIIPDLNIIKFNEGIIDCESVVRALETMPVFSEKKLVYVDIRMSKKSELKNISLLQEYIQHPSNQSILIICLGDNEDIDFIKDGYTIIDCNRLEFKIVSAKIRATIAEHNKTIDDNAIQVLFDYTIGDLSKILIECNKLVSYVGNKSKIELNDVKAIVTKTLEYQIYELTENLAKKNSERVFEILDDMKAKKDEYRTLPSLIYSHFRRLFMISLNANLNNMEIAKYLGIKEYAIKMSRAQASLFSRSSLKKINDLCIKLDFDIKQSNISIDNAINLIVITILNLQ